VIYKKFKKFFNNTSRSEKDSDPDADIFLSFLREASIDSGFQDELVPRIDAFAQRNKAQQTEELPGIYLFIEKYFFKTSDADLLYFREKVFEKFHAFISTLPEFQLIFLKHDLQVSALGKKFLTSVIDRLKRILGNAPESPWISLEQWLANNNSVDLPFSAVKEIQDNSPQAKILFAELSHDFFKEIEKRFNTNFILTQYNEVYDRLAINFQNLDSFHELILLFPNKTLDERKLNLLSVKQIKELLLEKVENLEKISLELHLKNEQLELTNTELHAQSDLLNLQNQQLLDAHDTIGQKNDELNAINQNLEKTVDDRTRELANANRILVKYNQGLEEYAFTVSHHLKAPVARLIGLTNLLSESVDEATKKNALTKIESASRELENVLKEIVSSLNIKRDAATLVVESCDVAALFAAVADEMKHKYHDDLAQVNYILNGPSMIDTDKKYLLEILHHIIDNAFKFRNVALPLDLKAEIASEANHLKLTIRDNGIGFPLNLVKEKLFYPYQRFNNEYAGRGMGLYFVKQFLNVLGGSIQIESQQLQGTAVTMKFPAHHNI
jgi:signal transduction histidine kinase